MGFKVGRIRERETRSGAKTSAENPGLQKVGGIAKQTTRGR